MTDHISARVAQLGDLVEGPHAYFEVIALGEAAIPALAELLRGPPSTIHKPRCLAADAIAQIGGPRARDALLSALSDSASRRLDPVLREAEDVVASTTADHLGSYDEPRVRENLLAILRHHAYPGCIRALARLHEKRAAPLLVRCLASDMTRSLAAEAMCVLGRVALGEATRALVCPHRVDGFEPPSWIDARIAATAIVAAVGAHASELPLAWALSDENVQVRQAAALNLAPRDIGGEVVGPVLIEGLSGASWMERDACAEALRSIGAVALVAGALPMLSRDGALAAVHILAASSAVEALADLSIHRDPHVRWAALDALVKLDTEPARTAITRYTHDAEPAIRERARHPWGRR